TAERATKVRDHLERTAISFDWIAATFNQDNLQDHRYLMSREVMMVFDAEVPGVLGMRYAPRHAAQVAGGWVPTATGAGDGSAPQAPGQDPGAAPPGDGQAPGAP